MLGKLLKQQVEVHDITFLQQIFQTDILVLLQQINITVLGAAALTGHVRKSVTGSGAYSDSIGEADATVHKAVQHTASEHSAHAATFKNQSCFGVDMYLFLHNYLIKRFKDSFCFRNLPIFVPVTIH